MVMLMVMMMMMMLMVMMMMMMIIIMIMMIIIMIMIMMMMILCMFPRGKHKTLCISICRLCWHLSFSSLALFAASEYHTKQQNM